MNKTALWIGIIVLVIIIGGVVMFSRNNVSAPAPEASPVESGEMPIPKAAPGAPPIPAPEAGTVKEFAVSGKNFSFTPSSLSVGKGDRVRITLKNTGGFHDLTIDEFGVQTKRINTGEEDTIEFTADTTGTFEYYCSVGDHRALGMRGTLTVK